MYLLIFIIILFFIFINYLLSLNLKENFCYGNVYCNGNKNDSLCINQECRNCGLQAKCKSNLDCFPNNCINGCCDQL